MSIIVFADNSNAQVTKASLEATSFARKLADQNGSQVVAVVTNEVQGDGGLGKYGADKVLVSTQGKSTDSTAMADLVVNAANAEGASTVVFSHDPTGQLIGPAVAVKLGAGMVSGVTELPASGENIFKKNVFSGKATAKVKVNSEKQVVGILPNSFGLHPSEKCAEVSSIEAPASQASVTVKEFRPTSADGSVPLPEAEFVVSAGRGLKGPENWGMVEDLAKELGATTACSRPVADIGWRPHHEHVGQTGVAIRPNLYIAIGISGAIQHLAGVNGSKVIVVINKDPEAPFFKAADYGIVGDAFDVVPKLVEALRKS